MMKTEGEFRSSDLYFSAFLATVGIEILRIDRDELSGQSTFVFRDGPAIVEYRTAWFRDACEVRALRYSMKIRQLKSAVHL